MDAEIEIWLNLNLMPQITTPKQALDFKRLAREISLIENETGGYEEILERINAANTPVIGITGPPGAGKSTLTDALLTELVKEDRRIAVVCVDPSSPFHFGALLGDRIRMSRWYDHPNVFIRSLASKGSLGGLHPKIIEITDLMRSSGFDMIIVETVGVGQSEVEIAGLADLSIVVLVPEAGDEVQTMKSGIMEIADIFVINKSDRPDADRFEKNLRLMLAPAFKTHYDEIPIIKTVATTGEGITELASRINHLSKHHHSKEKKWWLLTERAWQLIQKNKMKDLDRNQLKQEIQTLSSKNDFNLYKFVKSKI